MKIILISIGTRGDMEPFLAIGNFLSERGHTVICSYPEQFRHLAENAGLEFFSLGTEFIEMLESDDGKAALGGSGSGFKKFIANVRLGFKQTDINKALVKRQFELIEREKPDRIIYNGRVVYPLLWEMKHPGQTIMLSPVPYMHYVKGHTHVAFSSNFGEYLNKLTFAFVNFGMITISKLQRSG